MRMRLFTFPLIFIILFLIPQLNFAQCDIFVDPGHGGCDNSTNFKLCQVILILMSET